jgi:hypothetical protein
VGSKNVTPLARGWNESGKAKEKEKEEKKGAN